MGDAFKNWWFMMGFTIVAIFNVSIMKSLGMEGNLNMLVIIVNTVSLCFVFHLNLKRIQAEKKLRSVILVGQRLGKALEGADIRIDIISSQDSSGASTDPTAGGIS